MAPATKGRFIRARGLVLAAAISVLAAACASATLGAQPNHRRVRPTFIPVPSSPACPNAGVESVRPASTPPVVSTAGASKIRHVIFIMQENRSFDSYFGTYPGADGIPMKNGVPTVSVYNPITMSCQRPFYDPRVVNSGGPHYTSAAAADIHN